MLAIMKLLQSHKIFKPKYTIFASLLIVTVGIMTTVLHIPHGILMSSIGFVFLILSSLISFVYSQKNILETAIFLYSSIWGFLHLNHVFSIFNFDVLEFAFVSSILFLVVIILLTSRKIKYLSIVLILLIICCFFYIKPQGIFVLLNEFLIITSIIFSQFIIKRRGMDTTSLE